MGLQQLLLGVVPSDFFLMSKYRFRIWRGGAFNCAWILGCTGSLYATQKMKPQGEAALLQNACCPTNVLEQTRSRTV